MAEDPGEATRLLDRVRAGDPEASRALFERLYADMRRIAGRLFRSQKASHTLDATALVHEAFLKMVGPENEGRWNDDVHALRVAARAMRQVLANHARDKAAGKRGGGARRPRVTLAGVAGALAGPDGHGVDLLDFHDALERLASLDERQARIAEMRLLGGLPVEAIATLLGLATRTVELDWRMAKDALARLLGGETGARDTPSGEERASE